MAGAVEFDVVAAPHAALPHLAGHHLHTLEPPLEFLQHRAPHIGRPWLLQHGHLGMQSLQWLLSCMHEFVR